MTPNDVKRIRTLTGKSQAAFGAQLGLSPRTIRNWEAGSLIPDSAALLLEAVEAVYSGAAEVCELRRDWLERFSRGE